MSGITFAAITRSSCVGEFLTRPSAINPGVVICKRLAESAARRIRAQVEKPENLGKQIVIDIENGDYEIDEDGMEASRRLSAKRPDAALYGLRIGFNVVYTIGGVLTPTTLV